MSELVDRLIDLAVGVKVERMGRDGQRYTLQLPPDRKALVYLLDRIVGRPARQWAPPADPEKPIQPVIKYGANVRDPIAIHPRDYQPFETGSPEQRGKPITPISFSTPNFHFAAQKK